MFSWRVTKYNPLNRHADGSYIDQDEWTSFSEVGTKVSMEDYLNTEKNYINAITAFMEDMQLKSVCLTSLEYWPDETEEYDVAEFMSKMQIGISLSVQEVKELAKLTLREIIWCKLSYKKQFFVHFGYDYYMYIGTAEKCSTARQKVQSLGLYVEPFVSPHADL
ncbi:hypothetical protein [Domibacillus tundrae]|uniref:hypothetical protein n=1 Tax=Domibacillus tundrae TaxID=1587527 RepID=UPI000617C581|nr:hypothetical protein [Domibacillus tundrae]